MTTIRQSLRRGIYVAVIGCFTWLSTPGEALEGELLTFSGEPSEALVAAVSHALDCRKFNWYTLDGQLMFECFAEQKSFDAHLSGSDSYDLNGDGRNDLILGLTFPSRTQTAWEDDDQDLLLFYTVEEDGAVRQVFREKLDPGEQGRIRKLWTEDINGDGVSEILCVHSEYYWGAKGGDLVRRLLILRGRPPFLLLGRFKIVSDGAFLAQQAEIQFQDKNGDGIRELLLNRSEGPDDESLEPLSSSPDIYKVTFEVTSVVLDALRQTSLPEESAQALQALLSREFFSKQMFLQAVEQHIGPDAAAQYGELIVQTALGPYQLQSAE